VENRGTFERFHLLSDSITYTHFNLPFPISRKKKKNRVGKSDKAEIGTVGRRASETPHRLSQTKVAGQDDEDHDCPLTTMMMTMMVVMMMTTTTVHRHER